MRENDLHALHGYRTKRVSVSKPAVLIPNVLQRQFTVTRPNAAWVTDITYIRTWQGWLYLAVVMDLFSRKVIGWERVKKHIYESREIAAEDISDYIVSFYNRSRRHGHLGGVSPEEFERVFKQGKKRVL